MADQLNILISTSFDLKKDDLLNQLKEIQKNAKLDLGGDLTKQIKQAKELANLENKQLQNEKVKLQNERLALQNEKTKIQTSQGSEKTNLQSERLKLQNERLILQNELANLKKEKAVQTEQDTQKLARQTEAYSNLTKLVKEQYEIENKLLTEKDAKLQQQLQKELEINKARQQTYNNSVNKEGLFNAEKESQLLTQQYNLKEKLVSKENELAEARKKSTQISAEKNLQVYWEQAQKYINDYKNGLKDAIATQSKLGQMMGVGQSKTYYKYDQLTQQQQNAMRGTYNSAVDEIQKKSYQELNKLLTEEYNLRMRIEEAKLKRYQVASDNKDEQQRVTLLENELQEQLRINQAKRDGINTNLNDNRLVNQEKLNQLVERENTLKSELVIKQNQIASAQKISSEKAEYDLKMFQQSMNLQADSLNRKYSYVGGTSAEIEKYRQVLQSVTAENGKWYISQRQADGTMQQTAVTAQQLRMQYRQMRNEIQSNISVFDTLRLNIMKFSQYFFAGGITLQFVRQIREMFSYVNQMDKYLTNTSVITGKTREEVSGLTQEYIALGKALGATSTSVAEIAEGFYRQGKSAEETKKLIEATTMMSQLAGMGTSESTEYITSIMNGFKLQVDDVENVVSKLVSVDNAAATSVSEMAEALSKTSAVAQSTGVSLDSLVGYVATVSSTTRQEASSIGEAFKSIFTRMSDIKIGDYLEDGIGEANVVKVLDDVGVKLKENETTYRNFEDVISDLAEKWNTLSDVQMKAVSKVVAGTRQANVFMTLMSNMAKANELTATSLDSAGLAQDRYNIYLESTEAKLNRLKTSMQELYTSLLDSGFINMFIDGTTSVLNFISTLGGLPTVLLLFSASMAVVKREVIALMAINYVAKLKTLTTGILTFISNGHLLTNSIIGIKGAFSQAKNAIGLYNKGVITSKTLTLALTPALSLLSVGLVGVVSAIALYVAWQNKQKQAHEELMQSYADEVSANNEKLSSIESLKSQYEELSKVENKTVEDNEKLKSIQEELIKTLGLKKDAIDLLNDSWEENNKVIDDNTKILLERNLLKQNELVKDAQDEFDDTDNPTLFSSTGISKDKKAVQEIKSLYEELKADYGDLVRINSDGTTLSFDREKMSVEDFSNALYDAIGRIQTSYNYLYDRDVYDKFSNDVDGFTAKYENLDTQIKARYDSWSKLDSINIAEKLGIDDLSNLDTSQIQNIKDSFADFVDVQGDVNDTQYVEYFNDYVDSLANAETQTDGLATSISNLAITADGLENLAKSYEALSNTSDDLSSMIEKIKDTGGITQEVVNNVAKNYPELLKYLNDETKLREAIVEKLEETKKAQSSTLREMVGAEGGYYDEANALSEDYYKDKIIGNQETYNALQTELKQYYNALGVAYDVDFGNYKNVEQLKAKVTEDLINNLSKAWSQYFSKLGTQFNEMSNITKQLSQNSSLTSNAWTNTTASNMLDGNDMSVLAQEKLEEIKRKAQGVNVVADKEIADLTSKMNQLSNTFGKYTFDPVTVTAGDNSSKSSSGKSETDSLKEKYDKIIAQILSSTNDIERAIELSNQKIEMAELTGNTATANKEKENLLKLYDERKKLIHEQANQLRELLKTVKDEEIRATIGEDILDLQDSYHDAQITTLEDRISLVKELHDITIDGLNDELDLLNQQRTLMNQDSDEYKDSYAKEYKIVLNQQLVTIKSINDLKAQGYSMESDAIKELKDEWQGYESTRLDIIKSIAEFNKQSQLDSLEKANDGLESLLDMTMEMVKQRYNDEKEMIQDLVDEKDKAVQKEIDGYKAIIEAKKKMLKDEQDDRKYQQDLSERQQSIADKENRLEALSKDDSDKAKAEYKKLYEELKNERQDLDNVQYDHSIETQETLLDEELQRYEDARNEELEIFKSQKEAEIKEIEDYASRESNIREEAMKLIQGKSKKFYDELMDYNSKYSDGIIDTVVNAWDNGYTAMDKYNGGLYNVLDTIKKISAEMESINSAPLSQFVDTEKYNTSTSTSANSDMSIVSKMMQNSSKWSSASQEDKLKLADENKKLGESIGAYYDSATGTWYTDKTKKKKLYNIGTYHSGGFVGGLKSNEEFAKLLKGEFVVTDKMQNNFTQSVLPKIVGANSTPSLTLNVERFMDIDKLDNSTDLERLSTKLVDNVLNKITGAYRLKFGI